MKTVLLCVTVLGVASLPTFGVELKEILTKEGMPGWEEKSQDNKPVKRSTWEIKDGVLHCSGGRDGGWWGSQKDYTDFILDFEFKVPPGGNSGVYVRTPKKGHPSYDGMEVQILDDPAPVYKDIKPGQHCGSLYMIAPATKEAVRPAGEWSHMRIEALADHITVELNGETVVDADGKSHHEILKRSKVGPVGFQNHETDLWFRNIKFADLAADRAERSKWFRDAKFGMFIHWGVYSVLGQGEWVMHKNKIKAADYEKLPPQFDASGFDPQAWASLAKRAGCKYVVITSKHHDGFDMFGSKTSPYNVVEKTAYAQDPMKPLADAVRKEGLRFGFYHSVLDWHHPEYAPVPAWDQEARAAHPPDFNKYLEYLRAQVRELCTNYGPLACIWWDGGWDHNTPEDKRQFASINAMIRELQPQILINNRTNLPEDFDTPEQYIPPTGITNEDGTPKLWENCITLTVHGWWGYDKNEKEFKTPEYCIRMLVDIVSKGGNLLLNVGPDSHGRIGPNETKTLETMGKWLDVNGEAIYGTTASPFRYLPFYGRSTVKGDKLYVHVFAWPADRRLVLPGLRNEIKSARQLVSGGPIETRKEGSDWIVVLPAEAPDAIASVVELQLDSAPRVNPYVIRPAADGSITLPALFAEMRGKHGQRMQLESDAENVYVGHWSNPNDYLAWAFTAKAGKKYQVTLSYQAGATSANGKFELSVGDAKLPVDVEPTTASKFENRVAGLLETPRDQVTLEVKPLKMPKEGPLMNLREIILRPVLPM